MYEHHHPQIPGVMNGSYMAADFSAVQRSVMEVTHRRFVGNVYECFLFPGKISCVFGGTN
jgi:hypothetical protein